MQIRHQSSITPAPRWLSTGRAAAALGRSADTLKRYAKRDEFLIEGQHWRRGPHRNSPMVWNVEACKEAILRRRQVGKRKQQESGREVGP
ncbi:MAG: hypothetical protein WCO50_04175 [Synechococcus sp. ELA619]